MRRERLKCLEDFRSECPGSTESTPNSTPVVATDNDESSDVSQQNVIIIHFENLN